MAVLGTEVTQGVEYNGAKYLAEWTESKPFYTAFAASHLCYESLANVFMGGFYRLGRFVRLGAVIAQPPAWEDHRETAYNLLTRGDPKAGGIPPEERALLARAVAFPERAPLIERVDRRRRGLEIMKGHLDKKGLSIATVKPLAEPLVEAVGEEFRSRNLRVWEGVALYQEWNTCWLVFDGRAHRLEGKAWEIAKRILRKRKGTPLERARMAVLMARLGD